MKNFFKNKKIIITGHTGFKGSWLTLWLNSLGANIMGISLNPSTKPSHFSDIKLKKKIHDIRMDIRNKKKLTKIISKFKPDFIFHLAAQALVDVSYKETTKTWQTNLFGTINILEIVKILKHKCVCVIITSDKCYRNFELKRGYREKDELGGDDPYSASKGAAEIAVRSYVNSFFKDSKKYRIATARAGNVVGGGDWTNGRLIPDCMRSVVKNKNVLVRNLYATRPWQHVLEVIYGYLCLAIELKKNHKIHGQSFNFGPNHTKKVFRVVDILRVVKKKWTQFKWKKKQTKKKFFKESKLLALNCNKAEKLLKWKLKMDFKETINLTLEWYRQYHRNFYRRNENVNKLSSYQIRYYEKNFR